MIRDRKLGAAAALSGALAVAAGAYGAHGAVGKAADWLVTGSHYQLAHAIAALAVLALGWSRWAPRLFVAGGAIFAGTLYAMALGAPHWLGAVTPLGGGTIIFGWLLLARAALR